MRHMIASLGLGALLLAGGCNNWPHLRQQHQDQTRHFDRAPTAEQMVAYLNQNARLVEGLECRKAWIHVKQGSQTVSLETNLACQRPRNFRLQGQVMGAPEVDMGSNDQEFWYWVKRAVPAPGEPSYVYHCSYEDFRRGVKMPFPFQPDWIMEALGVASYDETKKYEVQERQTTVELIERTVSPQGQPVRKVTVFNRGPASAGKPVVAAYVLQDAAGKEIATASVSDVQVDQRTKAVVPRRVRFVWPGENVEMKMELDGVRVTAIDAQRAGGLFDRRNLSSLPSYDLARGPDAPAGAGQPGGLQRTGGALR